MDKHNFKFDWEHKVLGVGVKFSHDVYYPTKNTSHVIKKMLSDKVWEEKAVNIFMDNISNNDVVIDCGAYIGSHTLVLSRLASKVHAFEPQKLIYECLEKTFKNKDNVILYNVALYNKKGEISIGISGNDGTSSVLECRKRKFESDYLVECDMIDNYEFDKVDFIKIDTEGAEFKILEGAVKTIEKHRPKIIIEVFKHRKPQLVKWLKDNDYEIRQILNLENYYIVPLTKKN